MLLIWVVSRLRTPPARVRPLLEARRLYLQSFFDSIETQFGTLQDYLEHGLGLSGLDLQQLQAKMVEAD